MRKLKVVIVLVLFLLATGCFKYNINLKINNNKSFEFGMVIGISNSVIESMKEFGEYNDEPLFSEEEINVIKEKGYDAKEFSDEKYQGVIISRKFDNIDDFTTKEKIEFNLSEIFSEEDSEPFKGIDNKKIFSSTDGKTYQGNFRYVDEEEYSDEIDFGEMEMKFIVTLPSKPQSNNADFISNGGKTLTWDLELGKNEQIDFTFNLGSSSINNYIIIGGVALALVLITLIIINTKKGKPTLETNSISNENTISEQLPNIERPTENVVPEQKPEPIMMNQEQVLPQAEPVVMNQEQTLPQNEPVVMSQEEVIPQSNVQDMFDNKV